MKDYCSFADVFYGSGETNEFPETGIASKWFYIKALCGNTTPHAVLPFGKISVGAFSGGYPTGYGNHEPNYCGGVTKFTDTLKACGFSHLHQTGTGAIAYYYNYAVVSPFYGKTGDAFLLRDLEDEKAVPGYYSARLGDIRCEVTASHDVAYHRYAFSRDGGKIAVDFSNDGLSKEFPERFYSFPTDSVIIKEDECTVLFSGMLSGIKLYFCVRAIGENVKASLFEDNDDIKQGENKLEISDPQKHFGAVFTSDSKEIEIRVTYSTLGFDEAKKASAESTDSFEETRKKAYDKWNSYLSKIEIGTKDSALREKFYSNFYHSLIKPSILTGENVLGAKGDTVIDLGTFWDQYKTLLPLIYMLYKDEGKKISDAVINISRTLGKIPCSFGLTDKFPCEQQAKMLGVITLCDAYHSGLCEKETIEECIERELMRDDYKEFLKTGYFERYTHIPDVTDACLDVADITENEELKNKLFKISEFWKNAYGEDGLMSENSPYYEGDRFTYSFRLQSNIEERIALAGGKERYTALLDDFFGFGKESIRQITTTENPGAKIKEAMCHRFEGFNNECDMETPFSYIFTGRHDRLCEIETAAVKDTWRLGRNGLPGNNDSGGLSSCFIWLALGIFPWAGKGKMLLGCPQIESAKIHLQSGKALNIETVRSEKSDGTVKEIYFDGRKIESYIIDTKNILGGGTLKFIF